MNENSINLMFFKQAPILGQQFTNPGVNGSIPVC